MMRITSFLIVALTLLTSLGSISAMADSDPGSAPDPTALADATRLIRNFRIVAPGVYRGAIPSSPEAIDALRRLGIKSDIDLMLPDESDDAPIRERKMAEEAGIRFIPRPLASFRRAETLEINDILKQLTTPANLPVYFHCLHGEDRTGMIAGFYRVFVQNWNVNDAYAEMKNYNFHPILTGVNCSFREHTGLERPFFCDAIPHYHPGIDYGKEE
jgi:tyrosine-protein phosphatase SIW14